MTDDQHNQAAPAPAASRQSGWERELLERLAFAALSEQRRARRWGIFFKLFFAAYLLVLLVLFAGGVLSGPSLASRYTAVVDLEGTIADDALASAENVIAGLRRAFESSATAGVIVRANSPGGSPVQAAYIYEEIKRLRAEHPEKPLYAVVTDMCASGCYYAMVAADRIYVDRASVVGSIGVLMNGFGFVETLEKLGIERRLLRAGEHKGFLDPFSPMSDVERKHAQQILHQVHQQFIERVRDGRGQHLEETKELYSGLFWTGEKAIDLGLVDEIGSVSYVAREVIGAEDLVDFTQEEGVLDRLARRVGTGIGQSVSETLLGRTPLMR